MKYPSRDLFYEWGRDASRRLAEEADKIDSKGLTVFSFGSVIIGILASLTKRMSFDWYMMPFLFAFLCYGVLLWQSLKTFMVRLVIVADNPRRLKEKYWALPEDEAKEKYWESIEQSCDYNLYIVEKKGKALRLAIPALGAEVVMLVVWLLLRSLR